MIFVVGSGIWIIVVIVLVALLNVQGAAGLYRSIALAGPYAVLGVVLSLICEKVERYRIPDSWWTIIAALFYISLIIASVSLGSFVTWAALRAIIYLIGGALCSN